MDGIPAATGHLRDLCIALLKLESILAGKSPGGQARVNEYGRALQSAADLEKLLTDAMVGLVSSAWGKDARQFVADLRIDVERSRQVASKLANSDDDEASLETRNRLLDAVDVLKGLGGLSRPQAVDPPDLTGGGRGAGRPLKNEDLDKAVEQALRDGFRDRFDIAEKCGPVKELLPNEDNRAFLIAGSMNRIRQMRHARKKTAKSISNDT
jgi:hypothetical protein